MLEIYHFLLLGGNLCGSTCNTELAVAGQNYPDFEGALSSSPILPALKFLTSSCPFEVGPVELALTKSHMVVGAPTELSYSKSFDPGIFRSQEISRTESRAGRANLAGRSKSTKGGKVVLSVAAVREKGTVPSSKLRLIYSRTLK
jgi:hypothetical protein